MYEQRFQQWQIFYKYAKNYPEPMAYVKMKTVEVSEYLKTLGEDIVIEENYLFSDGDGKAVDLMVSDGCANILEDEKLPPANNK